MVKVEEDQCGLRAQFGEQKPNDQQLIQICLKHEAPERFTAECGYPTHAPLQLVVTPLIGRAGFEPLHAR